MNVFSQWLPPARLRMTDSSWAAGPWLASPHLAGELALR